MPVLDAPYKGLIRRLAALRRARGISQCELSENIGLDRGHISKYEAGFKNPQSLFLLYCWAHSLGLDIQIVARPKGRTVDPEQMTFAWPVARPERVRHAKAA